MDIGGYDTIYDTGEPEQLMRAILAAVGWAAPVFESDEEHGWFVYPDQAAKAGWDQDVGPEDTMIYFIVDPGRLTVVSDGTMTAAIRGQFPPSPVPP